MTKILVTGGLGYIGSHTVVELHNQGYEVVIIDDLSNSSLNVLDSICEITNSSIKFVQIDLKNPVKTKEFISINNDIDGVIHFAASKAVGESVENPLKYYNNNLFTLINLLSELKKLNKEINFIFSSSATVYGKPINLPITELEPIKDAESPYGNTKQIGEEIIKDLVKSDSNFKAISLRYFNPIGAHHSAMIGELPIGVPQNLVPYITQTAVGIREELTVFGNDYSTSDGSCLRDYIHVVDLAEIHIKFLKYITEKSKSIVVNCGYGKGYSVKDVANLFKKINKKVVINYKPRRDGDVAQVFADTKKIKKLINFKPKYNNISKILKSAFKWEKKYKD